MRTPLSTLLRPAAAALTLLAATGAAPRTAGAQALPPDSTIHAIIQARIDSGRAQGIIIGILENGARRYVRHGSAGRGRAPLSEHTLFEIGSISKVFTGVLLADAVVRGEVTLDQPVATLLPAGAAMPAHADGPITLEHLATHRSGLPRLPGNLRPADIADPYADYDTTRLYAFLRGHTPARAPGAQAEYSNLGTGLLGHALARAAGASTWGALVRERITGPLGMRETMVEIPASMRARMSAGHNSAMDTVPLWNLDALAGAGALRSSAHDMLTWLGAHLNPASTPLARAIELARQPRHAFGGGNDIALGWIVRGGDSARTWWHNGGTGGFFAFAAFDTARNVGIVLLANAAVPADDIVMHLLDPANALRMPRVPPRRTPVAVSPEQLQRLVGSYQLAPTFVLHITLENDVLYLEPTGQPKIRLWAAAPDRFYVREVDAELRFTLDGTGPATAVTLLQNGAEQRAMRRPE